MNWATYLLLALTFYCVMSSVMVREFRNASLRHLLASALWPVSVVVLFFVVLYRLIRDEKKAGGK